MSPCLPEFTLEVMWVTSIFLDLIIDDGREEEAFVLFLCPEILLILESGAKIPGRKDT